MEGTRMRTYDYCCMKRMRKSSIENMMTSDWGRFKGPPSASEWTFGSAGKKVMHCKNEVEDER